MAIRYSSRPLLETCVVSLQQIDNEGQPVRNACASSSQHGSLVSSPSLLEAKSPSACRQ